MKKIFVSFLLILTLVCNSPMCAYASSFGGGGGTHDMTGFNNWDTGDKVAFWSTNLPAIITGSIGLVINPLNWNYDTWLNTFLKSANNMGVALESDNYYDYVANMLSVNDNNELVVEDELTDIMYSASVQYIEEETGYFVIPTIDAYTYYKQRPNLFNNKTMYDAFLNVLDNLGDNEILCIYDEFLYTTSTYIHYTVWTEDCDFLLQYNPYAISGYGISLKGYNDNWEIADIYKTFTLDSQGIISENETMRSSFPFSYGMENHGVSRGIEEPPNIYHMFDYNGNTFQTRFMLTKGSRYIRAYKTLDDLKTYSLGTRPYYITDAFKNYDSTVDNSTTITQTEIDNSVTYGDVYNYITNNYENPDGLTEDELRAILAEYLSQINNNGGSGSGSGSGDSGSGSGSGLSGFLDGLGSLGDALLAIIGKLLEYVGKAIELLSGTVTKVIDLVPTTITAILGTIFSFFPQEWMTAIELALVLGVVIGIVGLLRK